LGGNSLSDLLVFGKRAGDFAARFATEHPAGPVPLDQTDAAAREALAPFERSPNGDGPFQVQHDLQEMMQSLVGIVRTESEMTRALDGLVALRERAARVTVPGNREFNPGWHTALDLQNLLLVSEAVTRAALERRESRGAHFRDDHPAKAPELGKVRLIVRKGPGGTMEVSRRPLPPLPAELQRIIEEMK